MENDFHGSAAPTISLVVPAYREGVNLHELAAQLQRVMAGLGEAFEVVIVDDGSPDETYAVIEELAAQRPWINGLRLSRNFGKEAALLAGLREARGRAIITLDADLQHPPDLIPELVAAWRGGAAVVHAVKTERTGHGPFYTAAANVATLALERLTHLPLRNASDYKLLDRRVVDILVNDLVERERFFRGLAEWVGFRQVDVAFSVQPGIRDDRRFSPKALVRLAATAMVSFTSAPLQLVTILGFLTLLLSVGVGSEALVSWFEGQSRTGFLTIIFTLLIIGSFVMISLGIIGAYLAKIYEELKRRPSYLVERRTAPDEVAARTRRTRSGAERPVVVHSEGPGEHDH
ncbi:MAG TPA: glycosyltransferase [Burkholderiaceae bacterium]|nr:glycosyltransferase [Burkholderiaceae bacterium]